MLSFIAAVYNEEDEILDLVSHVHNYVDGFYIADDGSTDSTPDFLDGGWRPLEPRAWELKFLKHTGLPETVKNEALDLVPAGSWVLMLDADERFAPGILDRIQDWLTTEHALFYTHVYFTQVEIIDGVPVLQFQKSKLFKKEAITFSTGIHEDDKFEGQGLYKPEWVVYHRKSSEKQKKRELEYLQTYDNLLKEGKIDEGRHQWLKNLHHYYKDYPVENPA